MGTLGKAPKIADEINGIINSYFQANILEYNKYFLFSGKLFGWLLVNSLFIGKIISLPFLQGFLNYMTFYVFLMTLLSGFASFCYSIAYDINDANKNDYYYMQAVADYKRLARYIIYWKKQKDSTTGVQNLIYDKSMPVLGMLMFCGWCYIVCIFIMLVILYFDIFSLTAKFMALIIVSVFTELFYINYNVWKQSCGLDFNTWICFVLGIKSFNLRTFKSVDFIGDNINIDV